MKINQGYKRTEVGIIPSDWEVCKLSGIGESIIGLTYSPSRVKQYGTLVLRSSNVQNGRLAFDDNVYVEMDLPKRVIVKENDILICVRNGSRQLIGKCALIDKKTEGSAFGAFMSVYRSGFSNIIFHQFQSFIIQRQINETLGATINQITNKDLASFQIPLPSIKAERTAIANALNDADKLITALEKLIAKKRNIKQGAMQELLKPKAGWEEKKLGEVLKVRHGKSQKQVASDNGAYPILASGGVIGRARVFLYDKPSVLIGRKGTIDEPQYMDTPFWSVDTLFYTDILQEYDAKFLFYMFNLINWYSYNEASGVPSLNAKTIESIEKQFPKFEEQTRIAQILSDMDTEIEALEKKLTKYKMLKQGMMQNLLTGRIRLV